MSCFRNQCSPCCSRTPVRYWYMLYICPNAAATNAPKMLMSPRPLFYILPFLSYSSFIGIYLRPNLLNSLPLLLRRLSILRCSLESLCAEAHVHLVLRFCTIASDFPEEAAGVAFIECGDDVCAICRNVSWICVEVLARWRALFWTSSVWR
jgi:hypothetical protein